MTEGHKKKISKALMGNKNTVGNKNAFKNAKIEIKCKNCGKVFKDFKGNHRKYCSTKCKNEVQRKLRKGKNCNFWKGGITSVNKKIRESLEYKKWRKSVYEGDFYTCQVCKKVGGDLEAHHIKSFASYPKLRFELDNGITLCKKCHQLTFKEQNGR